MQVVSATIKSTRPQSESFMKYVLISILLFALPLHAQTISDADFDSNTEIGFADFLLFVQAFGSNNATFDLNNDGSVNFPDFLFFTSVFGQSISTTPPNILLIIADDIGIDACPGYNVGTEKPNMPNLESLINTGIIFDNVWATPICSPTRATILTGKYGFRTGVLDADANHEISLSETSLQKYLDENAPTPYAQTIIGKWHLSGQSNGGRNNPSQMGITNYAGLLTGSHDDYWNWTFTENGQQSTQTEYATTVFTDLSINWVAQQQTPWFLWLAYTAPHTPFHLPPKSLLQNNTLSGTTSDIEANPLAYYFAMLQALDTEIGRLLTTIDRDNTLIIFIGDNGTPRRVIQSPFRAARAKGTVYEGGVHVPLIVSGKGITRTGQRESAFINSADLFATIADIANTGITNIHDSNSFKSLLTGDSQQRRTFLFTEVIQNNLNQWAVRDSTHKLIDFGNGTQEFYHILNDPYEQTNLLDTTLDGEASQAKTKLETLVQNLKN
ncbi:MAG: arylsulfatase A-like enzyme [Candidatus Latescibacterota bacterium]